MEGYIYFLTNPSMPGMVKVGHSREAVGSRLSQLDSTGVPTPFVLVCQFLVDHSESIEKKIHSKLDEKRVRDRREFFFGSPQELLGECFHIIQSSLISRAEDKAPNENDNSDKLSRLKRDLLLKLAHSRSSGDSIDGLCWHGGGWLDGLFIEAEMEELKQDGLVNVKLSRSEFGVDIWKITSKGVKTLFDIGELDKSA